MAVLLGGALVLGALIGAVLGGGRGTDDSVLVRVRVGPEGGTVEIGDGARLVVPRGALGEPVVITVRSPPLHRDPIEGDVRPTRAYAFEPADVRFDPPATLFVPVPPDDRPAIAFVMADGRVRAVAGRAESRRSILMVTVHDLGFSSTGGTR